MLPAFYHSARCTTVTPVGPIPLLYYVWAEFKSEQFENVQFQMEKIMKVFE